MEKYHLRKPPESVEAMVTQPKWQLDEAKLLTAEYTDLAEVSVYDARRKFMDIQAEDERIVNDLKLEQDQTVLDMGTGTGAFAVVAAKYCAKVYAVDLSPGDVRLRPPEGHGS